jgi:hypothetical protein
MKIKIQKTINFRVVLSGSATLCFMWGEEHRLRIFKNRCWSEYLDLGEASNKRLGKISYWTARVPKSQEPVHCGNQVLYGGPLYLWPSVWNFLYFTLLAYRILRWHLEFWKICEPLLIIMEAVVSFTTLIQTLYHTTQCHTPDDCNHWAHHHAVA